MSYRRMITTALISIGLAGSLTMVSAARRPAGDPQFRPSETIVVIADARPAGWLRVETFSRLFARARAAVDLLGGQLQEFTRMDPIPDQQSGGGTGTTPLGDVRDRGTVVAREEGVAHYPLYIGSGPYPNPM